MIPNREFAPRKPLNTLGFGTRWDILKLRPSGIAVLLGVEALAGVLVGVVLAGATTDRTTLLRLVTLVALSVAYAEITDRVERIWVWLHADRGAWIGQSSILLFAGVLVLPTWAALTQCLLAYAHIGLRNKRYATAPSHRWVWTATTVLLATISSSLALHVVGGDFNHVGALELLSVAGAALIYSGVNLAVLLIGMYAALRPPTLRRLVPARSQFSNEAAKLLLGIVGATLLVHAVLLTPAVLLFGAMLHRSTLVGELRTVAATDAKTGLLTYRAWSEQAARSLTRCERSGRPAALVLLDLDHFKQLNDTHGHAAGDRTLAAIGAALSAEVRVQDSVGRYGGEEFVVFLPGIDEHRALEVAQRLRAAIADAPTTPGVTASLGVAILGPSGRTLEQLTEAADTAMYRAKHQGRNTVCAASAA